MPPEKIDSFYAHLTQAVINTTEELHLPVPRTLVKPSWSLYQINNQRGVEIEREGSVSDDEYVIKFSPQWIEETISLGSYGQYIETNLLTRHEMLHLWQIIHLKEMRQRVNDGLEKIQQQRPEIYQEVKHLLTSKEMAARVFEFQGLQKLEATTIRQFLYKSFTLLLLKAELIKNEGRRRQLGIDF